ncbi:MAG: hypothetical protein WBK55_09210 [Alphaproteobacteria bacterium]
MSINLNDRINADNVARDIRANITSGAAGASVELLDRMGTGYQPTELELTSLKTIAFAAMTAAKPGSDKPAEIMGMTSQQLFADKNVRDALNRLPGTDIMNMQTLMILNNAHRDIDPEGADKALEGYDLSALEEDSGYEQTLLPDELQEELALQNPQDGIGLQGDPNQTLQMVSDLYASGGLPSQKILLQAGPLMAAGPQAPGPQVPGWVPGMDMNMKMPGGIA